LCVLLLSAMIYFLWSTYSYLFYLCYDDVRTPFFCVVIFFVRRKQDRLDLCVLNSHQNAGLLWEPASCMQFGSLWKNSHYLPRGLCPLSIKKKIVFRPPPNPPTARNPNYQGSRCLTLTSGQLMHPNVGANIKCGIAVWVAAKETPQITQHACRIRTPVHRSLQYPSYHYATTYLVIDCLCNI
jgi:hypothetical protein